MRLIPLLCWASLVTAMAQIDAQVPTDVRDFVRRTYPHGVPYGEATQYDAKAVPALLSMLADAKEERHWLNVVVTLGMIGAPEATDSLIAFIERGDGRPLNRQAYVAKTSAIMSLGYVANRNRGGKALQYLIEGTVPDRWKPHVNWSSPFHARPADRDVQLTTMAVLGLALSAQPEAERSLRQLKQIPDKELRDRIAGTVDMALRDHAIIARDGLAGYYKDDLVGEKP